MVMDIATIIGIFWNLFASSLFGVPALVVLFILGFFALIIFAGRGGLALGVVVFVPLILLMSISTGTKLVGGSGTTIGLISSGVVIIMAFVIAFIIAGIWAYKNLKA